MDTPLPLPPLASTYSAERRQEVVEYLAQLDDIQRTAYLIALQHLGTSFNVYDSNGFIRWKQSRTK